MDKKQEAIIMVSKIRARIDELEYMVYEEIDTDNFYDTKWLNDLCQAMRDIDTQLNQF